MASFRQTHLDAAPAKVNGDDGSVRVDLVPTRTSERPDAYRRTISSIMVALGGWCRMLTPAALSQIATVRRSMPNSVAMSAHGGADLVAQRRVSRSISVTEKLRARLLPVRPARWRVRSVRGSLRHPRIALTVGAKSSSRRVGPSWRRPSSSRSSKETSSPSIPTAVHP